MANPETTGSGATHAPGRARPPVDGTKISACILTYNHVHAIESTIASILEQSVAGYEVIVSDDCSTDGTWEKIQELARNDSRIRALRTPRNLGMPGNANFAIGQSTRPYIALLHHDDLYRVDLLERWAAILDENPDVSFVFNRYGAQPPEFPQGRMEGKWLLERVMFRQWGSPVRGTAMIRRSYWDKVGGLRERFGLLADVDLWMRLASISAVGYDIEPIIEVRALRPEYYPDIYTGKQWHWRRQTLLYEIHGANQASYFSGGSFRNRLAWWRFRLRLNCETAKWLIYAVVRKKPHMIVAGAESATEYDLWPLRWLRSLLMWWQARRSTATLQTGKPVSGA